MRRDDDKLAERMRLIRLIRRIAREEVEQALEDHVSDYDHKEKPAEEAVKLLEGGFQYVCDYDHGKILRKPK